MSSVEPGSTTVDEGRRADFSSFYDATHGAAYSLALRITGEAAAATTACEAAYIEYWRANPGAAPLSLAGQTAFLQVVRSEALHVRNPAEPKAGIPRSDTAQLSYTQAELVRAGLQKLDPFTRRSLELAYFGGLAVAEIAEIVGRTAIEIRQALRTALLGLGTIAPPPEETGR